MESQSNGRIAPQIRYRLTPRISTNGRISITLQLYRGDTVASTSSVATVAQRDAAEVMHKCKLRFAQLGVEGMPQEGLGRDKGPPRRSDDPPPSLPPAARLRFKPR